MRMPAPPVISPTVHVEVLLLRHSPAEGFGYRRLLGFLARGARPDDTARRLASLAPDDDGFLIHSTSWRVNGDGGIVLTYLVAPDPAPSRPGVRLSQPDRIARAASPGRPTPPELSLDHVAAHAIRHLAFLRRTDPGVAAHLACRPDVARALECVPSAVAGQLEGVREVADADEVPA
ncbi:hypothetical protein [Streptomyces phytohabitans]|uniref:hypothetical protein n=1 Tax=Streptomyces phytohabitans TaxID=1150371 RepID=UPI00345C2F79